MQYLLYGMLGMGSVTHAVLRLAVHNDGLHLQGTGQGLALGGKGQGLALLNEGLDLHGKGHGPVLLNDGLELRGARRGLHCGVIPHATMLHAPVHVHSCLHNVVDFHAAVSNFPLQVSVFPSHSRIFL